MAYLISELTKEEYLRGLNNSFESRLHFTDERITGFTLGPFFCVAHHNCWEWNRRITGECTRAYGFVRQEGTETKAYYVNTRGLLCPSGFLFFTVLCQVMFLASGYIALADGIGWLISAGIALVGCLMSALECTLTEAGEKSAWKLYKLLKNPKQY